MDYSVAIDINASPAAVWAELIDIERWPEMTPSITRVERLDDGRFGLGSRARVTQPKLQTVVWTVTDFQPGKSFSWSAGMPGLHTVGEHRLSPLPNGGVNVTLRINQQGPLAKVIELFYADLTRRYVNMEAQGLKRRCESAVNSTAAVPYS